MKADVLKILKMWYFLRFKGFEPELSAVKVESNFKKKISENGCHKKKTRAQFLIKSLFLLREVSKLDLKTSLRRNKDLKKNCARVIFF